MGRRGHGFGADTPSWQALVNASDAYIHTDPGGLPRLDKAMLSTFMAVMQGYTIGSDPGMHKIVGVQLYRLPASPPAGVPTAAQWIASQLASGLMVFAHRAVISGALAGADVSCAALKGMVDSEDLCTIAALPVASPDLKFAADEGFAVVDGPVAVSSTSHLNSSSDSSIPSWVAPAVVVGVVWIGLSYLKS